MASKIYPLGIDAVLSSTKSLEDEAGGAGMKIGIFDGTLTYNAAHDFLDDIASARVDGQSDILLTNPEVTTSTTTVKFDADDTGLTWSTVNDANDVGCAVVYYDTGVAATSPLIAFLDDTDISTNGSDIEVTLPAAGIFTLDLS